MSERKTATEEEIARTGESEASLRAREVRGRRWGYLFAFAAGIAIASAWWSADWFLSLSWEKALLAATIFVLPLIGWMALLTFSKEILEHWDLRKIFAGMGLVIILSSTGAIAALGWARMLGVGIQEEQRQAQQFEVENDTAGPASTARRTRIEQTKRLLNGVAGLAVVFLAIAGEVAAGIAYHEWAKHRDIVGTVRPFFRRREVLADALARNAASQEAVRKGPEILEAELTVKGLQAEAATQSFSPAVRIFSEGRLGRARLGTDDGHGTTRRGPGSHVAVVMSLVCLDAVRRLRPRRHVSRTGPGAGPGRTALGR